MAATDPFIAASKPLKEALRSANLLRSLSINALITGEPGTGRHTLAKIILPDATVINALDPQLYAYMNKEKRLIVERIDALENRIKFYQTAKKEGVRIIALGGPDFEGDDPLFFSVRIDLPPLRERPEDIPPLIEKFRREIQMQMGDETPFQIDPNRLDLSRNAFSLRRGLMLEYLAQTAREDEILYCNARFIERHIDEEGDIYRQLLYLYEVPLIQKGFERFKSQLKMAEAFGINRNTLRKKIAEWKERLKGVG